MDFWFVLQQRLGSTGGHSNFLQLPRLYHSQYSIFAGPLTESRIYSLPNVNVYDHILQNGVYLTNAAKATRIS